MTNEEAIKKIKSLCHGCVEFPHCVNTDPDCFKALEMAIDSLKTDLTIKEAYNKGYKDGQETLAFHYELCKEEGSIITVPDGATNGEVFEKLMREVYPKMLTIYGRNDDTKTIKPIFSEEWWNSPYRKEQE